MTKQHFLLTTLLLTILIGIQAQDCQLLKKVKGKYVDVKEIVNNNFKQDSNYYIVERKSNESNRFGIINKKGEEIVPTKYENRFYIGDNKYVVTSNSKTNEVWNLSTKTKTKIPFENTGITISEGLLAFEGKDKLWGYCSINGEVVLKPAYYHTNEFENDLAIVTNSNDKYGIVNKNGELVVSYKYDYIGKAGGNLFVACLGKDSLQLEGLIDAKDNLIVPIINKLVCDRKGLIEVMRTDSSSAYYSLDGKKLTDYVYNARFTDLNEYGYMVIEKKEKPIVLDIKAKEFLGYEFTYLETSTYKSGQLPKNLFLFSTKPVNNYDPYQVGIVNIDGTIILKEEFESIQFVPNNKNLVLVSFQQGNKKAYILQTLQGKVIAKDVMESIETGQGNYVFGRKGEKLGAIDISTGKTVIPFIYNEISEVSACKIALLKGKKVVVFDSKMKPLQ